MSACLWCPKAKCTTSPPCALGFTRLPVSHSTTTSSWWHCQMAHALRWVGVKTQSVNKHWIFVRSTISKSNPWTRVEVISVYVALSCDLSNSSPTKKITFTRLAAALKSKLLKHVNDTRSKRICGCRSLICKLQGSLRQASSFKITYMCLVVEIRTLSTLTRSSD